jgi:hypothetical protein
VVGSSVCLHLELFVLVVAIVGMPCVRDIFILKVLDLDGVLSRTEVCPS